MSNLTIANIFLFIAILCMALSSAAGLTLCFIYSIAATALAGAVRYQQLPHDATEPRATAPAETAVAPSDLGDVARAHASPSIDPRGDRMPTRTARTAWTGTPPAGLRPGRAAPAPSSRPTTCPSPRRAADEADGDTSPEELIAAAHSACYAMSAVRRHRQGRRHPGRARRPGRRLARPRPRRRLHAHRHPPDRARPRWRASTRPASRRPRRRPRSAARSARRSPASRSRSTPRWRADPTASVAWRRCPSTP